MAAAVALAAPTPSAVSSSGNGGNGSAPPSRASVRAPDNNSKPIVIVDEDRPCIGFCACQSIRAARRANNYMSIHPASLGDPPVYRFNAANFHPAILVHTYFDSRILSYWELINCWIG
jgi:hypothetical protein